MLLSLFRLKIKLKKKKKKKKCFKNYLQFANLNIKILSTKKYYYNFLFHVTKMLFYKISSINK